MLDSNEHNFNGLGPLKEGWGEVIQIHLAWARHILLYNRWSCMSCACCVLTISAACSLFGCKRISNEFDIRVGGEKVGPLVGLNYLYFYNNFGYKRAQESARPNQNFHLCAKVSTVHKTSQGHILTDLNYMDHPLLSKVKKVCCALKFCCLQHWILAAFGF